MATLQIKKKSLRTWEHIDSQLGMFILSKFYFSADGTKFQVVEHGQAKRRIYDITDISVFDIGGSAEYFGTITALSLRLEELKYPAYNLGGVFEFDPSDYDLADFNNASIDPFLRQSQVTAASVVLSYTNILSSDLDRLDVAGLVSYVNALALAFVVDANEIMRFNVTDTGQIFELQLNGRSFGGATADIVEADVLMIRDLNYDVLFPIKYTYQATGVGVFTGGTNVLMFQGTQTDTLYLGVSYRKITSAATPNTSIFARESSFGRINQNKGYFFLDRIKILDASTISDVRAFHGLQVTSGFTATQDPSANANPMLGFACDGADTSWQIMHQNTVSGGVTKIPLTTGFSKASTGEYAVMFLRMPNSSKTYYYVRNVNTGDEERGFVTNNPTALTPVNHRNTNASSIAAAFELQRMELSISV